MNAKPVSLALILFFLLLVSCSSPSPSARSIPPSGNPLPAASQNAASPISQTSTLVATQTVQPAAVNSPSATPTAPSATPTAAPNFTNPAVIVLATNLPQPDDLLVGPDGTIYVSDVTEGTIRRIIGNNQTNVFLSGVSEPEGMLLLADGSMVIVEQGRNRLLRWDAASHALTPLLNLSNPSGKLGVDGIALDARAGGTASLIIPDSPNDHLLRITLGGNPLTVTQQSTIARGLVRPTSAWVEADGSILVVEENGGFLDRVLPDGQVEKLARLPTPDDVVEDTMGNIFVTTLGDGALHWIDSKTYQDHLLVSNLSSPQGLAIDSAGNLIVTDPGNHRVVRVMIHP